jgi:hypothetical protein
MAALLPAPAQQLRIYSRHWRCPIRITLRQPCPCAPSASDQPKDSAAGSLGARKVQLAKTK